MDAIRLCLVQEILDLKDTMNVHVVLDTTRLVERLVTLFRVLPSRVILIVTEALQSNKIDCQAW